MSDYITLAKLIQEHLSRWGDVDLSSPASGARALVYSRQLAKIILARVKATPPALEHERTREHICPVCHVEMRYLGSNQWECVTGVEHGEIIPEIDAQRWRTLRGRYVATDFQWGEPPIAVLCFQIPLTLRVTGDADTDIDALARLTEAPP